MGVGHGDEGGPADNGVAPGGLQSRGASHTHEERTALPTWEAVRVSVHRPRKRRVLTQMWKKTSFGPGMTEHLEGNIIEFCMLLSYSSILLDYE